MDLDQVTRELDAFFRLDAFEPDSPFCRLVPEVYEGTGIELARYVEPNFLETFHGLMIRNGQAVSKIYNVVFLSDEMVGAALGRAGRDILLIAHHPLVMETSDRGFLSLSEACLVDMQERAISAYVLHTPLDVHDQVSTSRALAGELGLEGLKGYDAVPGGYAGVYGRLPSPVPFDGLLQRVIEVTGVSDLHWIESHPIVHTMAVLGGGTDVEGIMEATALGCDALVTGTYYNMVRTEIGRRYREAFDQVREGLEISLIECSHYASEAVVMRRDMVALCADRLGVDCEFIPQSDPWY